jgi:LysR family transcriptional regulator of gallate degradation
VLPLSEIETGALVVLPYPLESTRRRIGLTQRANALPSPAAMALMEAVRQTVKQIDGARP